MLAADPSWRLLQSPHRRLDRRSAVSGVVQHYTGGGNGRALAKWLAGPDARVSAHVVICRDGYIIQQVGFNDEAWHAGESNKLGFWKGARQKENANRFTIGIENSNYGWLIRDDEGFWIPRATKDGHVKSRPYKGPAPVFHLDHRGEGRWWEPFTTQLVDANVLVLKRILELYPDLNRDDVQHHSDVSPHRKLDPGPAWPRGYVLDSVFGGRSPVHLSDVSRQGKTSGDEDFEPREYYDEERGVCVAPEHAR